MKGIYMSFINTVIDIWKTYGGSFLYGLGITLLITLFSLLFSTILGLALGYLNSVPRNKKSNHYLTIRILQWISHEYIDLIRGTPLIVQAMFFYFGVLPMVGQGKMNIILVGVIVITLNAAAYLAEIFRGGIQAIDNGQMEASRSLGLSFNKSMIKVVLPQAIKNMIPAILNQFIISLKDTSILTVIGTPDLMNKGDIARQTNYKSFETMIIIALMYYVIIKVLSITFNKIEEKLKV
jgi:His/Glu/Gln/Arg/opine family amino acid ABC transporter permease subunit